MHIFKNSAAIAAAAALVFAAAPAMAADAANPATATVDVSATLTAACFIGGGSLAFGDFNSITQGGTAGTAASSGGASNSVDIAYTCSTGASPQLTVTGLHDASGQLNMVNGSAKLPYNLYANSGLTTALTPGGSAVALATGDGTNKTITLYGVVPASDPTLPLGAYGDTLTLSVAY